MEMMLDIAGGILIAWAVIQAINLGGGLMLSNGLASDKVTLWGFAIAAAGFTLAFWIVLDRTGAFPVLTRLAELFSH